MDIPHNVICKDKKLEFKHPALEKWFIYSTDSFG